jgi:hypothetical protein
MNGLRFILLSVVALFISTNAGWCQAPALQESAGHVSKIYSLADFGHDAQLCKWITDTIPTMIKPESWTSSRAQAGKAGTLSYYAPGKVLVIYQTPAVHAQVDEFLQTLKKTLPREQASAPRMPPVVPAQYIPANVAPPPMPAALVQTNGYPVPAASSLPKHLFHFIIRYEGEGIIDSNVVKFAKSLADNSAGGLSSLTPPMNVVEGAQPFRVMVTGNSAPVMPQADPVTPASNSGQGWRLSAPPQIPQPTPTLPSVSSPPVPTPVVPEAAPRYPF